jgi:hypothetical protein
MEPVIEKTRSRLDEWPLMDRKTASKCELDAGAGSGWTLMMCSAEFFSNHRSCSTCDVLFFSTACQYLHGLVR